MRISLLIFLLAGFAAALAQTPEHGVASADATGEVQVWDADANQWTNIEEFWRRYTERSGGLTWGRGTEYPEYARVSEFDTFMVELPQGPCLMMFFHTRWRRANDVRRWDKAFNRYGGCPHVFDD